MKKKRIIPIFLLNDMQLVQSRNFKNFEVIGNPFLSLKRFSEWMIDELIYLNITRINNAEHEKNEIKKFNKLIKEISKNNFMPITIGGKIKKLSHLKINNFYNLTSINHYHHIHKIFFYISHSLYNRIFQDEINMN